MLRRLFTLLSAVSLLLCVATWHLCSNSYGRQNGHFEVYVFGERAGERMEWFLFGELHPVPATPYEGQTLRIVRAGKEERLDPPPGPAVNQFVGQLDHMAECILHDRPPLISGEMGLQDMRIVDAIYRSAAGGGTVRI